LFGARNDNDVVRFLLQQHHMIVKIPVLARCAPELPRKLLLTLGIQRNI